MLYFRSLLCLKKEETTEKEERKSGCIQLSISSSEEEDKPLIGV